MLVQNQCSRADVTSIIALRFSSFRSTVLFFCSATFAFSILFFFVRVGMDAPCSLACFLMLKKVTHIVASGVETEYLRTCREAGLKLVSEVR